MPKLPWGALSQVDKAVARSQRPICQKILESLGHTHSTHRCCRSCLEPHEGVAWPCPRNSGSACHYPAPGLVAPSRTVKSFLPYYREIPCEKACSWRGRSCALLATVGSCRRCDIKHFCGLSWRRAWRTSLSNHIGPQEPLLEAWKSLRNTSFVFKTI
eukprot:365353-Chlamydomonas_euryale.AAC.26